MTVPARGRVPEVWTNIDQAPGAVGVIMPTEMAQADLETLVKLNEAFNREGWPGVFPFLDPEFEFHEPPEQPGATVFRGHEEARKGWAGWAEAWSSQRSEPEEVVELPDGRIFVVAVQHLRGRDGIEARQASANIFTFRNAKVLRWEVYWNPDSARARAGLGQ